jgi:DNA-binding transcriptional regulator LsrR (DeoR family)
LQNHWATRAATEFLRKIEEIGSKVWTVGVNVGDNESAFLNIGIVGGSTVKMIVQELKESEDWDLDFGTTMSLWGSIRILALNVCLTRAEELPSNANVLVNELREAIEKQVNRVGVRAKIHGVGLLATLLKPSDPIQYDRDLKELLSITDPSLLGVSTERRGLTDGCATQLHIVLTSIGAAKGSIFQRYDLAESNESKRSRIAGDLLYTCFDTEGEIVELRNKDGETFSLFSAVSLGTLEMMVQSRDRCVMLVARKNPGGEKKHVAIHSALQNHKYASCLILDRDTARDLYNRQQAMR